MNLYTEPARVIGVASAFLTAVVNLLVLFSIPISEDQKLGIISVFNTGAVLVATLFIRGFVYSPESYDNKTPGSDDGTGADHIV